MSTTEQHHSCDSTLQAFHNGDISASEFHTYLMHCDADSIMDIIRGDKDASVCAAVATHGTEEMQWQLIDDDSEHVRYAVAIHGTDDMRWKLIDDKESYVRAAVVGSGTEEMRQYLANDDNEDVRTIAVLASRDFNVLEEMAKIQRNKDTLSLIEHCLNRENNKN